MKKLNKAPKSLLLSVEKIRDLTAAQLQVVAGGLKPCTEFTKPKVDSGVETC